MNRKEFIKELEEAMLEQMDISEAAPHIRYYQDFIDNEISKGNREEDILARLHSPRLVAKNIIDNSESANKYKSYIPNKSKSDTRKSDTSYHYKESKYSEEKNEYTSQFERTGTEPISFSINGKQIKALWMKIVFFAILAVIVLLGIAVIGGILWIISRVVLPCIIIIGAFYIIKRIIGKWLK